MIEFQVQTQTHSEFLDITRDVQKCIDISSGMAVIYTPHTTCGLTINEGADPAVRKDALAQLDKLVPWLQPFYKHAEGNSAAHIKAMLMGNSVSIIVHHGTVQLGTWEKIFLCEFDGPRVRSIWVQTIGT